MFPGGSSVIYIIQDMLPGLNLFYTDLAQHVGKAGYYLDEIYTMTCPTCETLRLLKNIENDTFTFAMTLYHVALLVNLHRHCQAECQRCERRLALNVRVVIWYISIISFTWNNSTIAVGYTSFRLGTTTLCCFTMWHSERKSSTPIVLLRKFINGKAATVC